MAKSNGALVLRIIGLVVTLLVVLLAAVYTFGSFTANLSAVEKQVDGHETQISDLGKVMSQVTGDIRADVADIRVDMAEVKAGVEILLNKP